MLGRTDSRLRSLVVLALLVSFGIACVARLGYWQFVRHDDLVARARDQVTARIEVPPVRGTIYDRTGTVVLATSVERDRLSAFPAQMTGSTDADTAAVREGVAARLVEILGLNPKEAAALRARLGDGKAFVILAHGLTPAQSSAIKAGLADHSLTQLRLEPEPVRVYPLAGGADGTTLGAQMLGFVNRDGAGQYGIEGRWQDLLAGNPKVLIAERDGDGQGPRRERPDRGAGFPGDIADADDRREPPAQARAGGLRGLGRGPREERLRRRHGPGHRRDPRLRELPQLRRQRLQRHRVVRSLALHRPGRGQRLRAGLGLQADDRGWRPCRPAWSRARPGSSDQAVLTLDGGKARVQNADRGSKGALSFQDAVAWSRNVVMSKVALMLGPTTSKASTVLHDAWTRLGFGAPTGIDVAGEVPGLVRDPAVAPWQQIDLANGSFGQGVAVTLLQLATAYSAMVNGGTLPTPHVVKATGDTPTSDGRPRPGHDARARGEPHRDHGAGGERGARSTGIAR